MEGPLLSLAIRQAVRGGGRVVVIGPQPVTLPCPSTYLPVSAEQLEEALRYLADGLPGSLDAALQQPLQQLRDALAAARRAVLAGGSRLLGGPGVNRLFAAAAAGERTGQPVGVMVLLHGPNSYGGALLAGRGPNFDMLLAGIESGRIRALVCLEADPLREARDPARAQAALPRLDLLATLDHLPTATVQNSAIFLPTRTTVEADGSYINNEGRLQAFAQVMEPGLPLRDASPEGHPPREFFTDTPGDEPWPAWCILANLLGRSEDLLELRSAIADADPRFAPLATITPELPGVRLTTTPGLPHYQLDQETRG